MNGQPSGALQGPGATPTESAPRHLHPLTPLAHAAQVIPVALAAVVFAGGISFATRVYIGLAVAIGLACLVAGATYLQWQRFTFFFDDAGDLRVDSGILQRNHKKLQLSRLQSVEVNQPFWARLFGLAELTVEVAGAGESNAQLRYLGAGDAHELRNDLLARAAGIGSTTEAAPETVIATVGPGELLLALLIRGQTLGLFVLTGALLTVAFSTGGVGALAVAAVTGGVPVFAVVGEFLRSYGFTVARSPDGLRVRRGLTSTVANTVPPGRVHAVGFVSGPVWRHLGWVRVLVDLGGTPGSGDERAQGSTVLLPVSSWPVALEVVRHVLPGVDIAALHFEGTVPAARYRAPLQYRRIGVAITPQVLAARRGWLTQWLSVVPHGRVQSARITRGPWQRKLALADLHLDTVPGPVSVRVPHMPEARARAVLEAELDVAATARARDDATRWMTRRPDPHDTAPIDETGGRGGVDGS